MRYWFSTIHRTPKRETVSGEFALSVLQQHTAYFKQLGGAGRCLVAGPFAVQNTDALGAGFYLLIAPDEDAARELAAADPLIIEGLYEFHLREWIKVVPE